MDIAVDGFEKTMRRFRWLKRWDVSGPEDWETAKWLEGSIVIDTVARTVVWADEPQGLYLPRLINYLTEYSWPGWTAIWSPEDIYGTLRAAGVNPTAMLEPIPIRSGTSAPVTVRSPIRCRRATYRGRHSTV